MRNVPTIKNFASVDQFVCRGARPANEAEVKQLFDYGISSVLNLEWEQGDNSLFRFHEVNLFYIPGWEPLPWFAPSMEDRHIKYVLECIRRAPKPIYVHCRSGQNRTGVAIAAYRLIEKHDYIDNVLLNFAGYRGFWAWGDERYIRSLGSRIQEFV